MDQEELQGDGRHSQIISQFLRRNVGTVSVKKSELGTPTTLVKGIHGRVDKMLGSWTGVNEQRGAWATVHEICVAWGAVD